MVCFRITFQSCYEKIFLRHFEGSVMLFLGMWKRYMNFTVSIFYKNWSGVRTAPFLLASVSFVM